MGKRISQLAEITTVDSNDLLNVVDVSDTTYSASGTNKRVTKANLLKEYDIFSGWIPAGETWTYQSVDNPTGVYKVNANVTSKYSEGMKIKMTNGGNTINGIITKMGTYGGDEVGYTYITFLHEINPTTNQALHLMVSGAITNPYYSTQKAPQGFPLDTDKWSVVISATSDRTFPSPSQNVKQNISQLNLTIPIGNWSGAMCLTLYSSRASFGIVDIKATFSTTNDSETDSEKTIMDYGRGPLDTAGGRFEVTHTLSRELKINVTTKTPYYLNIWTTQTGITSFGILSGSTYGAKSTIKLVNAYL